MTDEEILEKNPNLRIFPEGVRAQLIENIRNGAAIPSPDRVKEFGLCEKHGRFQISFFVDGTWRSASGGCPKCAKSASVEAMLGRASVPRRYIRSTLDDYTAILDGQKEALRICQEYAASLADVQENGRCLMMLGKPGTGKTHLACGILKRWLKNGGTGAYMPVSDVVSMTRRGYQDPEAEKNAESVRKMGLLVLDEVGRQDIGDNARRIIGEMIDFRYREVLPSILISNLGPGEVEAWLGVSTLDRLREGGGKVVVFGWGSYRA